MLFVALLLSCDKDTSVESSIDSQIYYMPLDVGNKWQFDISARSGDSYAFFFKGTEDWEILEVSNDKNIILLKTCFNGFSTSRGWGSSDTTKVYNHQDTLTITAVSGYMKRVERTGKSTTISFLDYLCRQLNNHSENGLGFYFPKSDSEEWIITEEKNRPGSSLKFSYKLQENIGFKQIYFSASVSDWIEQVEFDLVDYYVKKE